VQAQTPLVDKDYSEASPPLIPAGAWGSTERPLNWENYWQVIIQLHFYPCPVRDQGGKTASFMKDGGRLIPPTPSPVSSRVQQSPGSLAQFRQGWS